MQAILLNRENLSSKMLKIFYRLQSHIEYHMVTEEEFETSKENVDRRNENLKPMKDMIIAHSVLGTGKGILQPERQHLPVKKASPTCVSVTKPVAVGRKTVN